MKKEEHINEELLKDLMADSKPSTFQKSRKNPVAIPKMMSYEENQVATDSDSINDELCHVEFTQIFLKKTIIKNRTGVYISRENFNRILTVVHDIGTKETLSISGYIENLINIHFEEHKETINTLLKNKQPKQI